MTSRGRGFGTRGYRGSGGGGYRGGYRGSNPRASYGGGRGGRGNYYSSGDRYSGGGERFSTRMDDGGYKKSYRNDGLQYSSRDFGGRMSPERKRMRMEGPTDRRSHDGGNHYGGGGGYGTRREYSDRREHRRSPSREMYRKSPMRTPTSGGRQMRSGPPRRSRGSLRGRGLRGRGTYRTRLIPSLASRPLRYRPKIIKMRSAVRPKHESASSTEEEDWDAQEEKKIMKEEGIEPAEDSPKDEGEIRVAKEEVEDVPTDKEAVDVASDEEGDEKRSKQLTKHGRVFIPLTCHHCKDKCITFRVYSKHLLSHHHKVSMSAVALRHNQKLAIMRARQRAEQRRLEDEAPTGSLQLVKLFCILCKLNHRQTLSAHQKSEAHMQIKRFLMPFCKTCRLTLRSPMQYEHHLLSIDHIKRKARNELDKGENGSGDDVNVDLENFMTLDSVGDDVDEVDDSDTEKKNGEGETKEKKPEINVGSEHIKKIEIQRCGLCKVYITTRGNESPEEVEASIHRHCRLRSHLSRYLYRRSRDIKTLRQTAERIHRIHQMQTAADKDSEKKKEKSEEKGEENEAADNSLDKGKEVKSESANSTGVNLEGTEGDEKLWADVDKDLGDLLREVDQTANKSSDDEDELNTGRYDRFRKSDKKPDNSEDVNGDIETNNVDVKQEKVVQPAVVAAETKQTA